MTHTVLHILKVQVWLGPHTFSLPLFFFRDQRPGIKAERLQRIREQLSCSLPEMEVQGPAKEVQVSKEY